MNLLATTCIEPDIMIDYLKGVMEGFKQKKKSFPETTSFWMDHPSLPDRIKALEKKMSNARTIYRQKCK